MLSSLISLFSVPPACCSTLPDGWLCYFQIGHQRHHGWMPISIHHDHSCYFQIGHQPDPGWKVNLSEKSSLISRVNFRKMLPDLLVLELPAFSSSIHQDSGYDSFSACHLQPIYKLIKNTRMSSMYPMLMLFA